MVVRQGCPELGEAEVGAHTVPGARGSRGGLDGGSALGMRGRQATGTGKGSLGPAEELDVAGKGSGPRCPVASSLGDGENGSAVRATTRPGLQMAKTSM